MTTQTSSRPVAVDELKRAWDAIRAGEFRDDGGAGKRSRSRPRAAAGTRSRANGEHTIAVVGCAGSVGASTVALALGLAAADPVRVVECCSATASGLAAASTAELGLHPADWLQGKRDHVLLERTSEILASVDEVPLPTGAEHAAQLTIIDVGWEAGQLLTTECWLLEAVRTADQVILVTTATVPGMRRATVTLELLANHVLPERIFLALRGPRRKKWPRGLEQSGGAAIRRALATDRCVEIPEDRELAVNGLDSRPVPVPLVSAASRLLDEPLLTNTIQSD